ncbi:hypothetical protein AB1N83_007121 [Pleurotus pulmonarius]
MYLSRMSARDQPFRKTSMGVSDSSSSRPPANLIAFGVPKAGGRCEVSQTSSLRLIFRAACLSASLGQYRCFTSEKTVDMLLNAGAYR